MSVLKRSLIGAGLVIALVATLVFVNPQPAEARGWTVVGAQHGFKMVACKRPINSIFGPLWKVEIGTVNGSWHAHVADAQVRRGGVHGPVVQSLHRTLGPMEWPANGHIYMSRMPALNDTLIFGTGELNGQGSGGPWSIELITYC